MTNPPLYLEDYANALGHVVISHNAMEAALAELADLLWQGAEGDAVDTERLMGRRSLDERLTMMAGRLNDPGLRGNYKASWIDDVDRLLVSCRPLVAQRHEVVHGIIKTHEAGGETGWIDGLDDWESVEELLELSDALDRQAEALISLIADAGPNRLG
ncbi:MAG: hypothetical protein KI792_05775 [Alphaproteobacteria bacterium]|nr:hypothetical protein [Alphaproteobacteria bacterium SS10]